MVERQPLDLFKFFTVVRDRGGLQEVSLFNRNSPAAASYLFHALSTSCMFSRSFLAFPVGFIAIFPPLGLVTSCPALGFPALGTAWTAGLRTGYMGCLPFT